MTLQELFTMKKLTSREREVTVNVTLGLSNAEIVFREAVHAFQTALIEGKATSQVLKDEYMKNAPVGANANKSFLQKISHPFDTISQGFTEIEDRMKYEKGFGQPNAKKSE